jgi:hypothetical protein
MKIRDSEECGKSELDLFSIPPTQTVMEEGRWDTIKPYSNFEEGTLHFDIEGDNLCYLDLAQTELIITVKLFNDTNSEIDSLETPYMPEQSGTNAKLSSEKDYLIKNAAKYISPVNNLFHSLFQQVQVKIGNTEVENTNIYYPYRAYFENLLCYDNEAKTTLLKNEMWIKDTAGKMDDYENENLGMVARRKMYTTCGKSFHMKGRIKSDIFNMNRYMLPQVNVHLAMSRSDQSFCFMTNPYMDKKFKCKITECALQVRRVRVNPSIALQHAMMLEKTTAKYPIKRVIMKACTAPMSAASFVIPNIHRGIMPSRVICAFVDDAGVAGNYSANPFNFIHLNAKVLRLKMASVPLPYSEGVRVDFAKKQYIEAYDALFQNIRNMGNDITYEEFGEGFSIFAFDLTPDLCNSEHFNMLRDGTLEMDVQLGAQMTKAYHAIFYLEFDNIIEITKERGVIFDFSIV